MEHKKYAVFTMDVEDFSDTECISNLENKPYADLLDGFDEYIKILDRHGIKSTLFTVGSLAPKIAERLKKCVESGHRIALHSYDHIAPMKLTVEQFKNQVIKGRDTLKKLLNTEVTGFRAPCFSIDNERLDVLKELGFKYDSSVLDFSAARHTVKVNLERFKKLGKEIFCKDGFFEFGLSKGKFFGFDFPISGGGYVRLNNWGIIKNIIKYHVNQSDYYVFYLHPFELTKRKIPVAKELKSYDKYYLKKGIDNYGQHIEQIIILLQNAGYEFVTFEQLVDSYSLEGVNV
jgi:peptidoglycan/xylan/chitin deacetylase (PgdA/CDA1 family)